MPRVVIPVLAGLFVGVLFLASNVAALHDPQPHGAPVAIAGAPAGPLQRALGGGYDVRRVAAVESALRVRDAYAGIDVARGRVLVASASMTMQQALVTAAPKVGVARPSVRDVVPLQPGDPRGVSLQQIVLGTILGGFMMGVLTVQLALGEPLWQRALAYAGYAVAFGLLAAIVLDVGAFGRVLGQPGVPLAVLLVVDRRKGSPPRAGLRRGRRGDRSRRPRGERPGRTHRFARVGPTAALRASFRRVWSICGT